MPTDFFTHFRSEPFWVKNPWPPIPVEVEENDLWQRRRLSMSPGITILLQVNGRNKIDFAEWMKMDLEYIDN